MHSSIAETTVDQSGEEGVRAIVVKFAQLPSSSERKMDVPGAKETPLRTALLADESGVVALDARIKVAAAPQTQRLAIRPYPKEFEEDIALGNGRRMLLRPSCPRMSQACRRILLALPWKGFGRAQGDT